MTLTLSSSTHGLLQLPVEFWCWLAIGQHEHDVCRRRAHHGRRILQHGSRSLQAGLQVCRTCPMISNVMCSCAHYVYVHNYSSAGGRFNMYDDTTRSFTVLFNNDDVDCNFSDKKHDLSVKTHEEF